jgi:hypothetical protein
MGCHSVKSSTMNLNLKTLSAYATIVLAALLSSCYYVEDPGPVQEISQEYTIVDFDRLEMGDAFNIEVEQGDFFEVTARGDRRNIEDLLVNTEGSSLVIRYRGNGNRRHQTYIRITMPELVSVNFSGASDSQVLGFNAAGRLDVYLSGASVCQLNTDAEDLHAVVSGASYLNLKGEGGAIHVRLSGASVLKAFNFPISEADVSASGASFGNVTVSDKLDAVASGASTILYRGNPAATSEVSGASNVRPD